MALNTKNEGGENGDISMSTMDRMKRELGCEEDATELYNAWQLLRACGAMQWQLDMPDLSSVRLRVSGINEVSMSVYRSMLTQCSQLQRVCVQWAEEEKFVVDVHIWNHGFYTDNPHIAVLPRNVFPGTRLPTDMTLPQSFCRNDRRTLTRIVSKMTAVQKHPPLLDAKLQDDRDGMRFVLILSGFTRLQLEGLNCMYKGEPQLQDIVVCKSNTEALSVRITLVRNAAKEMEEKKGVKRMHVGSDVVYKRQNVEVR